jgi:hypothetical protein
MRKTRPSHHWPTWTKAVCGVLHSPKPKEVQRMKISRKIRQQVEVKIRIGLATSALPMVERNSASGTSARSGQEKAGGEELDQAK